MTSQSTWCNQPPQSKLQELQHMCSFSRFMSAVGVGVLYQSQLIQQETSDLVERKYDDSSETDNADEN